MSCLFVASLLELEPVTCPPSQDGTILEGVKQPWVLRPPVSFWSSSPSALSIHLLGSPGSRRGQRGMLPDTRFASSAQLSWKSLRSSVDPLACPTTSSIHWTQETQKDPPPPFLAFLLVQKPHTSSQLVPFPGAADHQRAGLGGPFGTSTRQGLQRGF